MITNWRLTSDIVLMFENTGDGNKVYIASPEKKQYEVAISKLSGNIYGRETIENTNLEIKIGTGNDLKPKVLIKTNQLPTLDWAEVANFYEPGLWSILSQGSTKYGVFKSEFKAVFSESDLRVVSFVSPDMTEYSEAEDEMKRRLRCEIGRKTKNLKPGHKYDLPKETRYYLCDIVSRKYCEFCSDFQDDNSTLRTPAYIYTNKLNPSDLSVSDVLRNRKFGTAPEDLKIAIREGNSWIESGEVLKDDFTGNIKDYWESIITRTTDSGKQTLPDSDYIIYPNLQEILEILSIQSSSDLSYTISEELQNKLKETIESTLEYTILKFWNLKNTKKELELSDTRDFDLNVEALERLFYIYLEDGNVNKFSYYRSLFDALKIDIKKLAKYTIANFSEADLTKSFEDYLRYRFFWKNKRSIYYSETRPILDFSLSRTQDGMQKVEDIFGRTELSKTIKELFQYAMLNYGDGVEKFIIKLPDKKATEPDLFCYITLKDIVKFKKGVSKMSESLKNDIVLNKFDNIVINCKLSDTI